MESNTSKTPTASLGMNFIYLDHSTTTPIAKSVRDSMQPFLQELYGHPSSQHWLGRAAAEALEDARGHLATLLECHPSEIIFTSGGTESINLGLLGVGRSISRNFRNPHCIISNLDHVAVRQTAQQLQLEGWQVSIAVCNNQGIIEPGEVAGKLLENTRLISITHASHELGTIQPIQEISQLCHDREVILHTDAAQTVGKINCPVQELGVDILSLSGHKFHAPKGIGALYLRLGVSIDQISFGEWLESGLRPGTQNVADIVGLGQAAKLAQSRLSSSLDRISVLRDQFHSKLERLIGSPIPILGVHSPRLPGILTILLPKVKAFELQQRLPDICFGPTSSMTDDLEQNVPTAWNCLGISIEDKSKILRLAIGWTTSEEELDQAAHRIASAYESLVDD